MRERGFDGPCGACPWPRGRRRPERCRARRLAALRRVRAPERVQARAAAAGAFARFRASIRTRGSCSPVPPIRRSSSSGGSTTRVSPTPSYARTTCRRSGSGRCCAAVDASVSAARADDGRDVCGRGSRAVGRHAARRVRRRLVLGAARRRCAEGRAGRARGGRARRGARDAVDAGRPRRRWAPARSSSRAPSTTSSTSQTCTPRRSSSPRACPSALDRREHDARGRIGARSLVRAVPVWAWLAAIVVVSAGVRFLLARGMVAPWIMVDELDVLRARESFAATGHLAIRGSAAGSSLRLRLPGADQPGVPALRPRCPDAYVAAKAINSVVMSLAAIPAYFLARRVLDRAARARSPRSIGRCDPVAALHGDADDGERVLSALPVRRARARADA